MRLVTAIFLASSSLAKGISITEILDIKRTNVTVYFEYKLEIFNSASTGSTKQVLGNIDGNFTSTLQQELPNGGSQNQGELPLPNVIFETIDSTVFSQCFTKADECDLIHSNIIVSYVGPKPKHSIELVTIDLVQKYLKTITAIHPNVVITYQYPMVVQTLTQFSISRVGGPLGDVQVGILENTFLEVFGAIVYAAEGDTQIIDSQFLYQELYLEKQRRLGNSSNVFNSSPSKTAETQASNANYMLVTNMLVTGYCRFCTSTSFGSMVDAVISQNLIAYAATLKANGNDNSTKYFDNVSNITFSVPELPNFLPPSTDNSIFDSQPPHVHEKQPWFLWFGLSLGLCFLFTGCYWIYNGGVLYEGKEEASTSESEGDDEEGIEVEDGDEYVEESQFEDGTYQDLEEVETVVPTETRDGQDTTEVYVF